jgi:hypothetical protein
MTQKSGTAKREYRKPELMQYGDVRKLTQNVNQIGVADTGGSPPMRT